MLEGVSTIQSGRNILSFPIVLDFMLPNPRLGAFSLRSNPKNTKFKGTNRLHASKEYNWAELVLHLVDVALYKTIQFNWGLVWL